MKALERGRKIGQPFVTGFEGHPRSTSNGLFFGAASDSDTQSDNLILVPKKISATDAARSFADVLTRVSHRGEEFIVERGGEPVCRISPVGPATRSTAGDLARAVAAISWPDAEYFAILRDLVRKQDKISLEDPWAR